MNTYSYTDWDGAKLNIGQCDDQGVSGHAHVGTPGDAACINQDHLPAVVAALYEAAGKPAPIVLDRTDETVNYTWILHGIGFVIRNGGVEITHPNGAQLFEPAIIRGLAARLAEMAEAAEARAEPDSAEVEELAAQIRHDLHPDSGKPSEGDRSAARTALRWMKQREQS